MNVADGRCFGSSGTFRDDRRLSGIWRGHDQCRQEGCVDGGGEGESNVSERAAAEVCVEERRV